MFSQLRKFLNEYEIEKFDKYLRDNNIYINFSYSANVLEDFQIGSLDDIKKYIEDVNYYNEYLQKLRNNLIKENTIRMSKKGYLFVNDNTKYKGWEGDRRTRKYIFDNYISKSDEYNYMKNNIFDFVHKNLFGDYIVIPLFETIYDLFIKE